VKPADPAVFLFSASSNCGIKPVFIESWRIMKCILCDQRKAKRSCPAKKELICAVCCGEKRVLEINCPESCEYLKSGRARESADYGKRLRNMDKASLERNRRVLTKHQDVVAHLEYTLSRERLLSRYITDREAAEALDILVDTYKTEDKGVLYEKTSDSLRVDSLRRELRKVIESYRNPEGKENQAIVDPGATRLQLGAAIDCLEFIRSMIDTYLGERHSASSYLDFLARITPREEAKSSIIVP
jgi:hypothetical protein